MNRVRAAEEMRQRLSVSLQVAIKDGNSSAAAALRSAMAAIENAGAIQRPESSRPRLGLGAGEAERRELSRDEVMEILRQEISDRVAAAADYDRHGRPGAAEHLRAEAAALSVHLER